MELKTPFYTKIGLTHIHMKFLNYSIKQFFFVISLITTAQERQLNFFIVDSVSGLPIEGVEVYNRNLGLIEISN